MQKYWKFIVAAVGAALVVLTNVSSAIPAAYQGDVTMAISVLTAIGVYLKANAPA